MRRMLKDRGQDILGMIHEVGNVVFHFYHAYKVMIMKLVTFSFLMFLSLSVSSCIYAQEGSTHADRVARLKKYAQSSTDNASTDISKAKEAVESIRQMNTEIERYAIDSEAKAEELSNSVLMAKRISSEISQRNSEIIRATNDVSATMLRAEERSKEIVVKQEWSNMIDKANADIIKGKSHIPFFIKANPFVDLPIGPIRDSFFKKLPSWIKPGSVTEEILDGKIIFGDMEPPTIKIPEVLK